MLFFVLKIIKINFKIMIQKVLGIIVQTNIILLNKRLLLLKNVC